jgi:hypothetical protein
MTVNLQVNDETFKLLLQIKNEIKAANYDQVLKYLVNQNKKVPRQSFSPNFRSAPFSAEDMF